VLRFDWNALRVSDAVVLHDPSDPEFALITGTVVMLETKHSRRGVSGVGIRVATDDGHRVVWPSYLTFHHHPPDPSQKCWRCEELVETAVHHLVASDMGVTEVAP
jgi:hypothetical protein